jgi:antitoxin PrlF
MVISTGRSKVVSEYTSVITRKGQATVPVDIRRLLGLEQGDKIAWVQDNGHVVVRRAQSVTERTAGILRQYACVPPPTIEELKEAAAQGWVEGALDSQDEA